MRKFVFKGSINCGPVAYSPGMEVTEEEVRAYLDCLLRDDLVSEVVPDPPRIATAEPPSLKAAPKSTAKNK